MWGWLLTEVTMIFYRLLTAAAAFALASSLTPAAIAKAKVTAKTETQAKATAKTEAQAKAATGKPSSDAPANTAVQGTAKAVKQGAAPAAVTGAVQAAVPAPVAVSLAKPVVVQGDLVDTLRLSGQFTGFLKGVDATNLTKLLKENKNLTVFAPTDAAFAALPAAQLAALQANKTAMQKFILHHVVNAPIDSAKIKGHAGPVATAAGDSVNLDGSDEATLKADGARIVQADVRTTSGLLQVVDQVLVAGQGATAVAPAPAGTGAPASTAAAKPKT